MATSRGSSGLFAAFIAMLLLSASAPLLAQQDYVGAAFCANCHPLDPSEADNYGDWRTSGHRFILQEGFLAQHRPLPLPAGPQLGRNQLRDRRPRDQGALPGRDRQTHYQWEKAIALDPSFDMAIFNLAVAYLERGDKAKALESCEKYLLVRGRNLTQEERQEIDEIIRKCKGGAP